MTKLDWSKAGAGFDPARVVDVGDYGILSDEKAGRKGNLKPRRKRTRENQSSSNFDTIRAFPEAKDGRATTKKITQKLPAPHAPKHEGNWTNEDTQILLLLWRGGISAARIAALLKKSKNAVRSKANFLKINRRK